MNPVRPSPSIARFARLLPACAASAQGVEEIRVSDSSGADRVIYLARRAEAVYVLHAFHKKTQATLFAGPQPTESGRAVEPHAFRAIIPESLLETCKITV